MGSPYENDMVHTHAKANTNGVFVKTRDSSGSILKQCLDLN